MIELRGITKAYGTAHPVRILHGIDLRVEANDYVAIVGQSGSGKSTLLKVIGLMHRPTSGRIAFHGKDVTEANDDERTRIRGREVGFVFQSFQLIPHLTLVENVELPLFYQRVSRRARRRRAEEILERVGLSHRLTHVPNELSGGECQRAAVARALVTNPSILLADEPTGNLDVETSGAIETLFHDLHEGGATIVLITHDEGLASRVPRTVRICDGRIAAEAASDTA